MKNKENHGRKGVRRITGFLTRGIWHIDIESRFRGGRRFAARQFQILFLQFKLFFRNRSIAWAAGLSFTTLLSLIPLLAIIFMVLRSMTGSTVILDRLKPFIYQFLNPGAGGKLSSWLDSALRSATIDTIGILGILFLVFSTYTILFSIEEALNRIWGVKKNRAPLEQVKSYLAILLVLPVVSGAGLVLTSSLLPAGTPPFLLFLLSKTVPVLFIFLLFMILIKGMPNCRVDTGKAAVGAIQGTILTLITKEAFFYYTGLAVSTNLIYGSLAVLPILMLWIFSFWLIVLFTAGGVYVRHNLQGLRELERQPESSRTGRIRTALLVALDISRRFLAQEGAVTMRRLCSTTGCPLPEIREALSDLEKAGLIARTDSVREAVLPAVPQNSFTIGAVIDAVDRLYLSDYRLQTKSGYPALDRLFDGKRLSGRLRADTPLEKLLPKRK